MDKIDDATQRKITRENNMVTGKQDTFRTVKQHCRRCKKKHDKIVRDMAQCQECKQLHAHPMCEAEELQQTKEENALVKHMVNALYGNIK